ncbi:MAG: hypothetical protein PHE09_16175, partial [Oscillospiraceae bacterium]|nr:hypothetical protein [Oscillospiraceae bacterium]
LGSTVLSSEVKLLLDFLTDRHFLRGVREIFFPRFSQNKMAKKMSSAFLPMTSPFIGLFRQRYPRSKTHRFWGYHLPFLLPSVYSNFHLPISLQKSRNTIKKVNAKSGRI